jgi:hypothetical protein
VPRSTENRVEPARLPLPSDLDVFFRAFALRHARVREIGQRHQQQRALLFDTIQLGLELLDSLSAGSVGREDRRCVLPLPFGTRHLVGGGVLLALEPFDLGDQPAAARFEGGDLLQLGVRPQAAALEAAADILEVFTHQPCIQHG